MHGWHGYRWILACLLLLLGGGALQAQDTAQPQGASQPETTPLVRLSFVQGGVRILQGDQTLFDPAQLNMPLLKGYAVATGEDGEAEIEFTDGSVARLAPNSELKLERLADPHKRDDTTEVRLLSGLGYFELNTNYGQRFKVHFSDAEARPATNAIFRINLDATPEMAVLSGGVRALADGGLDRPVDEGNTLTLSPGDESQASVVNSVAQNSWDQWNQDRDHEIAEQAQQQTTAGESTPAAGQPGWDDLDQYGDWYPVEGYGNVWVPGDQPDGWDPYGYGAWADYPGIGYTWVSGYPWGWLPYRCGAWNYWNSVGWGWIPSGCGAGWYPYVGFLSTPAWYRPPPRPIPGGHIGPPTVVKRIIPVNHGPTLPHPGGPAPHGRPIVVNGQRIEPLPVVHRVAAGLPGGGPARPSPGVGFMRGNAPVRPTATGGPPRPVSLAPGRMAPVPLGVRPAPGVARPAPGPVRQMYAPPPRMAAPAPRMAAPAPAMHMSAPPPAAHH